METLIYQNSMLDFVGGGGGYAFLYLYKQSFLGERPEGPLVTIVKRPIDLTNVRDRPSLPYLQYTLLACSGRINFAEL